MKSKPPFSYIRKCLIRRQFQSYSKCPWKKKKKEVNKKKNISLFISLIKLKNNKNFYSKNYYKLAEQETNYVNEPIVNHQGSVGHNRTKRIKKKKVKNLNKIFALLHYHRYQTLDQNWEGNFINSILLHQTKFWKLYFVNTNQTSDLTAILEFTM